MLGRDIAEQQLKEQMAKMQDPVIQQQNRELDLREAQIESKVKTDAAKIAADLKKAEDRNEIEKERISSQEFLTGLKVGSDVGLAHAEMSDKNDERTAKELLEGVNTGIKMAEKIKEMREE